MRWVALNLALLGVFTLMAIVGLLVWADPRGAGALDGQLIFGMGVCGMLALVLFTVLEHLRGAPSAVPVSG